jgi:hypothetical protein
MRRYGDSGASWMTARGWVLGIVYTSWTRDLHLKMVSVYKGRAASCKLTIRSANLRHIYLPWLPLNYLSNWIWLKKIDKRKQHEDSIQVEKSARFYSHS